MKGVNSLSQRSYTLNEIRFLREALSADCKISNIRLREGEYQFDLAKVIAAFQLELHFPNVKEIVKELYGEEKTYDVQFVRKIQTILKKMEKSNVIKILPKKKPWELQRYALSSFKFQDIDKNLVVLATEEQMRNLQERLRSILSQQEKSVVKVGYLRSKIFTLLSILIALYVAILWDLTQPISNPIIFVVAFSVATVLSVMLGKLLSKKPE